MRLPAPWRARCARTPAVSHRRPGGPRCRWERHLRSAGPARDRADRAGVIRDGMVPKVRAAIDLLDAVDAVWITDGRRPHPYGRPWSTAPWAPASFPDAHPPDRHIIPANLHGQSSSMTQTTTDWQAREAQVYHQTFTRAPVTWFAAAACGCGMTPAASTWILPPALRLTRLATPTPISPMRCRAARNAGSGSNLFYTTPQVELG